MIGRLRDPVDLAAPGPYYVTGDGRTATLIRSRVGRRRPAVIADNIDLRAAHRISRELNRAWADDPNDV